jgi:hypothetical protein
LVRARELFPGVPPAPLHHRLHQAARLAGPPMILGASRRRIQGMDIPGGARRRPGFPSGPPECRTWDGPGPPGACVPDRVDGLGAVTQPRPPEVRTSAGRSTSSSARDFQARLSNSVVKFVAAYARMNGRGEPVRQDVDNAFRLIGRKYEFVGTLAQHLNLARGWETPEGPDLEQWLRERFPGQRCTTAEVLRAYQEAFGLAPVRRTIERHLPRVARRLRKGLWEFPPAPRGRPASSRPAQGPGGAPDRGFSCPGPAPTG